MTRTTTLWSLLLLSAALALGSCTKDATEQATGPEPEAKAASKLVFSSENAVRGELLVCFGEEAVAGIESSVMQVTVRAASPPVRASLISTPCSAASG